MPLSDTESSSSSSPPIARLVKHRRGRPKKAKPEDMVFSSDAEAAAEPAQGTLMKPPLDLADLIRPTGGGACELVDKMVALDDAVSDECEPQDAKLLQAALGVGDCGPFEGAVNSGTNPTSLARLLGVLRRTVQRQLPQLADAAGRAEKTEHALAPAQLVGRATRAVPACQSGTINWEKHRSAAKVRIPLAVSR